MGIINQVTVTVHDHDDQLLIVESVIGDSFYAEVNTGMNPTWPTTDEIVTMIGRRVYEALNGGSEDATDWSGSQMHESL